MGYKIADGYKAKWHKYDDPPGKAPLGYSREGDSSLLAINPATMPLVVRMFERYALRTMSLDELAGEFGLNRYRIADVLSNPIYKGIVRYKGASKYRADLRAISDNLFEQAQAAGEARKRAGGPARSERVDLLSGLLMCAGCGARIGRDGYGGKKFDKQQRRHRKPCNAWGEQERYFSERWLLPLTAQLEQINTSDGTVAAILRALEAPPLPADDLAAKRIERERDALYRKYRSGALSGAEYVAADEGLQQAAGAVETALEPTLTPDEVIAYLRDLPSVFADADDRERSDYLHAVYQRVEVLGPMFTRVTLTPHAEAHGLALALPEAVSIRQNVRSNVERSNTAMVGARGFEPPTPWPPAKCAARLRHAPTERPV